MILRPLVTLPAATLLALVPPVLVAMLVPLSVAGWGIREGTAALVWGLVGLPPAQGVAVSMAYGLLVLLASLPGLLWLPGLRRRREVSAGSGPLGSGSGQVEVEEGIVPASEGARQGTAGLVQGGDGRHGQARAPGADQQRGEEKVQPMEHAGFEETRYRDAATLDQHTAKPELGDRQASRLHHQGGQAIEQGTGRVIDRLIRLPAGLVQSQSATGQASGVGTITGFPQRLPGIIGIQASHHRYSV